MKQTILASFLVIAFASSLSAKAGDRPAPHSGRPSLVTNFDPPIPCPKLPGTKIAATNFDPPIPCPKLPGTKIAVTSFDPPIPCPKLPGTKIAATNLPLG